MNVEIKIPGADALGRVFLTWTPVEATARVLNPVGTGPIRVTLRNAGSAGAGRVRFATTRTHLGTPTLALNLPIDGTPVRFFVAGEFGRPSVSLGDAVIQARRTGTTTVLGRKPVTVRVRKNAQTLSPAERDRFVAAFGTLNGGGAGRFRDFRDMHVLPATAEAHGDVGFLPWHRAYLLDLERELQAIDPSVALPYWRFDQAAPNVFTREFMGVSNAAGTRGVRGRASIQHVAHGRGARHLATAAVRHRIGTRGSPHRDPDPRARRRRAERRLRGLRRHGGQPARLGAHPLQRVYQRDCDSRPRSAVLHAARQRRPPVGQVAVGAPAAPARPRRAPSRGVQPGRASHSRHDVALERRNLGAETVDGTGRHVPTLALDDPPGLKPKVGAMIDYQAVGGGPPLAFAYDDVPFEL